MSSNEVHAGRVAGILGFTGGMLLVVGDLLMYGHAGPASAFHQGMIATVREAPLWRLFLGGMLGLPLRVSAYWVSGTSI